MTSLYPKLSRYVFALPAKPETPLPFKTCNLTVSRLKLAEDDATGDGSTEGTTVAIGDGVVFPSSNLEIPEKYVINPPTKAPNSNAVGIIINK